MDVRAHCCSAPLVRKPSQLIGVPPRRHAKLSVMLLELYATFVPVRAPITGCLSGLVSCSCEWVADDTDQTTLAGLSHPGSYSAAAIAATGLPETVIKAADTSPQACERVCCEALVITDAPAAPQAPAQTGPCDVWQHGGGTGAAGCWLGLDNKLRKPPLPEVPDKSTTWTGGAGKRCRLGTTAGSGQAAPAPGAHLCSSNWGIHVLVLATLAGAVYLGTGVALGYQQGRGLRTTAHPHFALWQQLHGLVLDGVEYVRRVRYDRSSAYTQVDEMDRGIDHTVRSFKSEGRQRSKEKAKGSATGKKRAHKTEKTNEPSLEMLGDGATELEAAAPSQTSEERRHTRPLEERAQLGVHSSQAKVTVIGLH